MATYFPTNDDTVMVIVPPNSEVGQDWQRLGNKPRSVGGYYVSNMPEKVKSFLADFFGSYSVDLAMSYYLCQELYEKLIANCSSYYADGLQNLKKAINFVKASIADGKEADLLFEVKTDLTDSSKYLHIDNISMPQMVSLFRKMILGDILEIVFKKTNSNTFVVYLRPRAGVIHYLADESLFGKWIKENTKK